MEYRSFAQGETGSVRVMSGLFSYDEKFIGGRLAVRAMNACGQVVPEMHLWDGLFDRESCAVFSLAVGGEELLSGWQKEAQTVEEKSSLIILRHEKYPIRVSLKTTADGFGWLSRELRVANTGACPLALTDVKPFRGVLWHHQFDNDVRSYTPAECGLELAELYEAGYSECHVWGQEGDFRFHPLAKELSFDSGFHGRSGWSRPSFVLKNRMNGQLFACEFAYSGNWKMRFMPSLSEREAELGYEIGFSTPEGEALRVLLPGEEVEIPAVHFTLSASGMEELIHSRHHFIRNSIIRKDDPLGKCLIEANHRGYLCDRESEEGIRRDIKLAADAGAELYVIDAGWFGKEPNQWWENVGDWQTGAWLPNDLYPLIDYAHELGMKFGLWMEFEAAGNRSDIRASHPEYFVTRDGEPVANGRALDLSKPEVAAWVEAQMADVIERYKLDMFRIDHNHHMLQGGNREYCGYTENTLWRYMENLYKLLGHLAERFPCVSFQNCAAGGGRLDTGILRFFHHTEISDWARPPRAMKLFNGMLAQLPPEIQLRIFGTEVCEYQQDADLKSQWHSIMQGRIIMRGIAPNEEERSPLLEAQLEEMTKLYKEKLRPILSSDCNTYLHTPLEGVLAPSVWSANEFALPDRSAAFAVVHKLRDAAENCFTLRFKGIDANRDYLVSMNRSGASYTASGRRLMQEGILLQMNHMLDSELIYLCEA